MYKFNYSVHKKHSKYLLDYNTNNTNTNTNKNKNKNNEDGGTDNNK